MGLKASSEARAIARWRPADPGLASLRRGLRIALVMPPALAFTLFVLRDPQITLFTVFGSFALLVMADFGGIRPQRAMAYAITVAIGATLLVAGTLASPVPWVAALAMFAVAFCIQFLGVFGGYAAAAQLALQLLFVLAVSIPAPPTAIGSRVLGWLIAGTISTIAAVFLWPRFERLELHKRAADACAALAHLLQAQRRGGQNDGHLPEREAAGQAVRAVSEDYSATAKRPAGPTRRDRAFVEMLTELERTLEFIDSPFGRQLSSPHPCREESDRLAAEVARTLLASAQVLKGGRKPDLLALERARAADRAALDDWAGRSLRAGESPEEILRGLDAEHALRVVSYLALAIGTNAIVAAGGTPDEELQLPAGTPREGPSRVLIRIGRTIRTHLTPNSSILHNALRSAVGLGLAVLLARLLQVDHAFWVVLGTASVLRTNALATGRTMVEALLGTLVGFAIGAAFTAVAINNPALLWAALPFVAFLAGYASTAVGFVVGQAAFTVNVLILFNLISPVGWRLGLARIEDVAIGAGISLVVGLLLWPRGARQELARSMAGFYRSVAAYLAASFSRVLEGAPLDEGMRARLLAVLGRDRARESLEQFLNERAAKRIDPEVAAKLLASGSHAIMVGDNLNRFADMGYRGGGCPQAVETVRDRTHASVESIERLADRLARARPPDRASPQSDGASRDAALSCLRRWAGNPQSGRSAIAIVVAVEWLEQLTALTTNLEEPVQELAGAARVPWWR